MKVKTEKRKEDCVGWWKAVEAVAARRLKEARRELRRLSGRKAVAK